MTGQKYYELMQECLIGCLSIGQLIFFAISMFLVKLWVLYK